MPPGRSTGGLPACGTACLVLCMAASLPALRPGEPELATEDDRTLYALGLSLAAAVSGFHLSRPELELVSRGLADGVLGRPPHVSADAYRARIDALAAARMESAFQQRERAGRAYRAEVLATRQDAVLLPSGSIAIPLRAGSGARPALSDSVRISYSGSLTDGTVFERTQPGKSLAVSVSQAAMPCLTEGLLRMRVGSRLRLACPPDRDFSHPEVPLGSTLV
ncbi:MAG: FKBP-type peptidyl-prolyl cis-trans isomerase, partial [Bryobacterales bacterium]|nr:FKBP-type peptidyl-prolyl cis-trans isomerase [Bryobacterales bacterium]